LTASSRLQRAISNVLRRRWQPGRADVSIAPTLDIDAPDASESRRAPDKAVKVRRRTKAAVLAGFGGDIPSAARKFEYTGYPLKSMRNPRIVA
jgi:hypothetical protein